MSDNKLVLDPGRETKQIKNVGKKRKNSNVWLIVVALIVVATIIGVEALSYYSRNHSSNNSEKISSSSILNGTVESKNINHIVSGSSTLKEEKSTDYKFISGVELSEVYYRNGDKVSKNDIIARVDKVSVMSSIASCQKLINSIDTELRQESKSKVANKITAPADGRVKQIFVEKGRPVIDSMYNENALVVLSLDGMMSVTFESTVDVTVGSEVDVKTSKGTIKGTISSYTNGKMKITVSDKELPVGELVTVSYNNANIGSGNLQINSPLNVTAFVGNVKKVNVKLNQKVKKDDVLVTLTETSFSDKYDTLLGQRSDLENAVADLIKLYSDGVIYAEEDGIINGLDEDLYKESKDPNETKGEDDPEVTPAEDPEDEPEEDPDEPDIPTTKGNMITFIMSDGTSIPSKAVFKFTSEAGIEYSFKYSDVNEYIYKFTDILTGSYSLEISDADVEGYSLYTFQMAEAFNVTENNTTYGGIFLLYIEDEKPAPTPSNPTIPDIPGYDFPSYPGNYGYTDDPSYNGTEEPVTPVNYTVTKNVFFSITPQNKIVIKISVDEMDLSKIALNQTATIKLDAYPNESFEGAVTEISRKGQSNGVRSKFEVKITLDKNEKMLEGMNASVKINVAEEEVISLPIAAITQKDGKSYIYTTYDSKTKTLGGETEITTGYSDGVNIEIIDGVTVGQEFWYEYYDTIDYSKAQAEANTNYLF